jgi:RNA polymerase sigma-70 factor, ECF subfamily
MAETRPEPEGFEQLYRRHRASVYRFLLRDLRNPAEAEDVTQTAFMQAYRAYKRGTRPERPHAWLITIADNLRKRAFRTRQRRAIEVALDEAAIPDERADVDAGELREALEALPFNQRSALVLREVAGLSYGEIADHLRVSVGSVQMLLFRARKTLRGELASAGRRGLFPLPTWLANLLSGADRIVALRTVGAALVAATTAGIAVGGAEPAQRLPSGEHHRPPAARATSARKPARVVTPPARRASLPAPRVTLPHQGLPAEDVQATPQSAPAPSSAPAPEAPSAPTPLVAQPPVALPPVPPPPPVALPLPALPLPALPTVGQEGALDPQQLGVLAGR